MALGGWEEIFFFFNEGTKFCLYKASAASAGWWQSELIQCVTNSRDSVIVLGFVVERESIPAEFVFVLIFAPKCDLKMQ